MFVFFCLLYFEHPHLLLLLLILSTGSWWLFSWSASLNESLRLPPFPHPPPVPDDIFAPDFVWKGSYDYRGHKQPMTLTVSSFNATTGKVNVTLFDSSVEFQLSGESSINHLSLPLLSPPALTSLPAPPRPTSIYFSSCSCQSVNQPAISCMRGEINYWP